MSWFEDGWFGSPTTLIEMTLGDMVKSGMRVLHVLAPGETPDPTELADAIQAYAMMMAEWASAGLTIYSPYAEEFTLTAGTQVYRIGVGSTSPDFDTVRPSGVHDNAYLRDSSGFDSPVDLIGEDQWSSLLSKTTSGRPSKWRYRPDYPFGTLFFWPIPDEAYTFYLNSEKELVYITDATSTIALPGYYLNAIKYNLALNLAPEYEKEPSLLVQRRAKETLQVVERRNADAMLEPVRLGIFTETGGDYDVNTDTWRR